MDDWRLTVKERPILFSAPMVRAILAGEKTVTRRLMKERHATQDLHALALDIGVRAAIDTMPDAIRCPYGEPGDSLWVRETHLRSGCHYLAASGEQVWTWSGGKIEYCADGAEPHHIADGRAWMRKMPSIHMPRWASRITLLVTSVRLERLRDITESEAWKEGVGSLAEFHQLWWMINRDRPTACGNPWVWRIEFRREP